MSIAGDVKLLTAGEVASLLGIDPKVVSSRGYSGRLLSSRTPGGTRRYFPAEVEALAVGETPERARELALAERARMSGGRDD